MADLSTLRGWLGTLEGTTLEAVLEHNPNVLRGSGPRDLDDLAMRLEHPSTVSQMLMLSPAPVLQVVETASALGYGATLPALRGLLERAGGDEPEHADHLDQWLHAATLSALLWVDGDQIRLNPGIDQIIIGPLALARPARQILADTTADRLRSTLRAWEQPVPNRKAEMLAAVQQVLSDPRELRRIAGRAPEEVFSTLDTHITSRLAESTAVTCAALTGADLDDDMEVNPFTFDREAYLARRGMWQWAQQAGLTLGHHGWSFDLSGEFPTELYLALAPPDFRARFDPQSPPVRTAAVPAEQLGRTSAAALAQFLGTTMAILEGLGQSGLKTLKSGGIGARELARYAKQIGTDVPTVRLALALSAGCSLLDEHGDAQVTVSEEFDTWRRKAPAERAADLVQTWLHHDLAPTLERDTEGKYLPLFGRGPETSGMPAGFVLTRTLMDNPGRGAISGADVFALLTWRHPMSQAPAESMECSWAEGHQLGVLADGAVAPFAEALSLEQHDEAVQMLTGMLPEASRQVMFGSDLTIVVPGSPDPEVVDLLDVLATREGHGVANTWRVSEDSVRDALDSGYAVGDLIPALQEIAGSGLPQALEYLLRDVARRHGHLEVQGAASVIISSDEALVQEVAAARSLKSLQLRPVAPTVVVSAAEPGQTMRALRKAGYLPIEVDDGGARVVQLRRLPNAGAQEDLEEAAQAGGDTSQATVGDPDDDSLLAFLEELHTEAAELGLPLPGPGSGNHPEPESPGAAARRLITGRSPG